MKRNWDEFKTNCGNVRAGFKKKISKDFERDPNQFENHSNREVEKDFSL